MLKESLKFKRAGAHLDKLLCHPNGPCCLPAAACVTCEPGAKILCGPRTASLSFEASCLHEVQSHGPLETGWLSTRVQGQMDLLWQSLCTSVPRQHLQINSRSTLSEWHLLLSPLHSSAHLAQRVQLVQIQLHILELQHREGPLEPLRAGPVTMGGAHAFRLGHNVSNALSSW